MKISGVIVLDEMDGRKDPWVVKKTKNDYFLALKITEIDGIPVNTTSDLYSKLYSHFPDVKVDGASFNHLFTNVTLPNGAKDIAHITLGYFPDFRFHR
ncbi:MAG TPA: hypothetical protein VL360_06110, partial [Gammaproteobacteria bacterium]|nr:hypothetical protein [Gammaproteobacteria bacterium]